MTTQLARLGRADEARAEFGRAAALTGNQREKALFLARAEACRSAPADPGFRC
jgi:RNA polymerase sigma-70 factor (ECF subfamily)